MAPHNQDRSIKTALLACIAAVALFSLGSGPPIEPDSDFERTARFMLVDLGTLGGEESGALGMNDDGTVVGWSDTGARVFGGTRRPFLRRLGEPMIALASPALGHGDVEARAINDLEQVVGVYTVDGGSRGVFWNGGVPFDLTDVTIRQYEQPPGVSLADSRPCLPALRVVLEANAINDWAEIVGCALLAGDDTVHGILLTPHEPFDPISPVFEWNDLGRLPAAGECITYDVNNVLEAVGVSGEDAFIWDGAISALDDRDRLSEARAINNWGVAAGWTGTDPQRPRAARWEGEHRFDLGHPRWISQANAIADNGQVVGWTALHMGHSSYAALWDGCDTTFLNLATVFPFGAVWHLEEATAIDRMGYIAGFGTRPDGAGHAFLLVPLELGPGTHVRGAG